MMKIPSAILLILVLISCEDKMIAVKEPKDLIPRDTMVMVLKDISLIESHIQSKYLHVSRFQTVMRLSGNKILKEYGLNNQRFENSMDYYGSRQDEMSAIYSQVLDSLNKEASMLSKDLPKFDSTKLQNQMNGFMPLQERPR